MVGFFQGGGVKCLSYIGALLALKEKNIEIEKAAGTSGGSIIACLLMAGYEPYELYNMVKDLDLNILVKNNKVINIFKKASLKSLYPLEIYLNELLTRKGKTHYKDFFLKDGDSKLKVICTDLKKMDKVIFPCSLDSKLEVAKSVIASCAMPGIFEVVKINNMVLADGGIVSNIPKVNFIGDYKKIYFCLNKNKDYPDDGIVININVPYKALQFDLSLEDKINLIKKGYDSCKFTLNNI